MQYIAYQDLFGPANASQLDQLVLQVCVRVGGARRVLVCVRARLCVRLCVRVGRMRELFFFHFENFCLDDDRNARSRSLLRQYL